MGIAYERGDHVRSTRFPGVALWFVGHPQRLVYDPMGYDPWDGEPEREPDTTMALVRMVGDDRDHEVGLDTLTPLPEDDFCGGCGQIGCAHG